jgi:hypothetical protein
MAKREEKKGFRQMKMTDIRKRAKELGIKSSRMKKVDLIRSIQASEDNIPCFGTERVQYCGEEGCLWRDDCLKIVEPQSI